LVETEDSFAAGGTMRKIYFGIVIGIFLLIVVSRAQRQTASLEWPQFRGSNGSGVGQTTKLPSEFGPEKNMIWKKTIPTGYSSPVLTRDRIFLTACENEKLLTLCLVRKTGNMIWKKEAPRPRKEKIDFRNNPASPSPATDGQNVYVFFPDFGLLGYSFDGEELWRLPLGPFDNEYGMGASPIVAGNKVILVCDQNTDSFIVAVEKLSGKILWKKDRPEATSGHSTPVVYSSDGGETQILVPGSFLLISYSAETGERLWWTGGLSFEMKSTPVIRNGTLFINGYASPLNQPENQAHIPSFEQALAKFDKDKNSQFSKEELPAESPYDFFDFVDLAKDGHLDKKDWNYFEAALASLNGMLAIRLGGQGDMTENNTLWVYRRYVPQLPSPLVYKDVLYMINDVGFITSFHPENGTVINQGRLREAGSKFFASPVAADNKVFVTSLRGKVSVLKADGSNKIIAINDLDEDCYATPAIGKEGIFIRTVNTLYCFGPGN
jgi:outer membrane protein assembly factor BamB